MVSKRIITVIERSSLKKYYLLVPVLLSTVFVNISDAHQSVVHDKIGTDLIFSVGSGANFDDILINNRIGLEFHEQRLNISTLFLFRPYEKVVRVKQSDNYYRQYRTLHFGFGLIAQKRFTLAKSSYFITGGPVINWGKFKGSSAKPDGGLVASFGIGLEKKLKKHYASVGYRYLPVPYVDNHQLFFAVTFRIWKFH